MGLWRCRLGLGVGGLVLMWVLLKVVLVGRGGLRRGLLLLGVVVMLVGRRGIGLLRIVEGGWGACG